MLLGWCGLAFRFDPAYSAALVRDRICRGSCLSLSLCIRLSGCQSQLSMQMLDYNVPGGKLNRGMAVLDVVKALRGKVCLLAAMFHLCWPICMCQNLGTTGHTVHSVCARRGLTFTPIRQCLLKAVAVAQFASASKLHLCLRQVSPDEVFKANALGWCIEWLQAYFLVADDMMDNSVTRRGQPCWYRNPKVKLLEGTLRLGIARLATALLMRAQVTGNFTESSSAFPALSAFLL